MSAIKILVEAAEIFAAMDVTALAETAMKSQVEDSSFELSRMLSIQQSIKQELEHMGNCDPDVSQALYNVAHTYYTNDSDTLQINVDPVTVPFDVSCADGGKWVSAWVWVPTYDLEAELSRLKSERHKAAQPVADSGEQDITRFEGRSVDATRRDNSG